MGRQKRQIRRSSSDGHSRGWQKRMVVQIENVWCQGRQTADIHGGAAIDPIGPVDHQCSQKYDSSGFCLPEVTANLILQNSEFAGRQCIHRTWCQFARSCPGDFSLEGCIQQGGATNHCTRGPLARREQTGADSKYERRKQCAVEPRKQIS